MQEIVVKALRVRLSPNKEQKGKIDTTINCCRFVYNYMLARNEKAYKRRGDHLNYNAMQNLLPEMKEYLPWLAEADSQALKYACRQLSNAYEKFFKKKAGYPNFKSKRNGIQSYTTTHASTIHYEKGRVKIPCIGWVKVKDDRQLTGKICYITIVREYGKYYASITYKTEVQYDVPAVDPESVIGLDYKSNGLYVDSNGVCAEMPHFYREAQEALAKEHRKLSRKVGARKGEKPSGNFRRQQKKLQKKSHMAANQRRDYLHKQSTAIAKQYDAVCAESLNMRSMANKSFGNGKATMDNGYGMFLYMLEYKLRWQGKQLVRIDKWYPSSQICHSCGTVHKELKNLQIRKWVCPDCGTSHDRDENAAINIRDEGLRLLLGVAAA